jgi:uncharacterized membrane protein
LNTYETLLWLHVLFAILWVGGNVMLNLVAMRARTSGDSTQLASLFRTLAWFGGRYFVPVSLLTLVFGFWITAEGDWSYSENPWIGISLAIYTIAFLAGMLFFGPESSRIVQLLDDDPAAEDPHTQKRMKRYLNVAHADASALMVIVFLMAAKPLD